MVIKEINNIKVVDKYSKEYELQICYKNKSLIYIYKIHKDFIFQWILNHQLENEYDKSKNSIIKGKNFTKWKLIDTEIIKDTYDN